MSVKTIFPSNENIFYTNGNIFLSAKALFPSSGKKFLTNGNKNFYLQKLFLLVVETCFPLVETLIVVVREPFLWLLVKLNLLLKEPDFLIVETDSHDGKNKCYSFKLCKKDLKSCQSKLDISSQNMQSFFTLNIAILALTLLYFNDLLCFCQYLYDFSLFLRSRSFSYILSLIRLKCFSFESNWGLIWKIVNTWPKKFLCSPLLNVDVFGFLISWIFREKKQRNKKSCFLVNSCCFCFAFRANLMSDGKKENN